MPKHGIIQVINMKNMETIIVQKKRHNINVKEEHECYNYAKERHNINTKKEHECNISAKEWFNNNARKKKQTQKQCQGRA
jgi:hypothetical protein